MLERIRSLNLVPRNDALLVLAMGVILFALTAIWAVALSGAIFARLGGNVNNWLVLAVLLAWALVAMLIPRFTWGRNDARPRATSMVRFGMSLQFFAVLISPIGIYYATNPVIAVPIGYGTFLAMFLGVFVAGFGGNMLAPPRA